MKYTHLSSFSNTSTIPYKESSSLSIGKDHLMSLTLKINSSLQNEFFMLGNLILLLDQGYATVSLGCYMVCCYNNSFISGRLYTFELLSFIHFTSYDRPYALKIKYPVTRGYQFLLDKVFACCCMKGLACLWHRHNEHNLDRFVGWFSCCILYISQFSFCLLYHSHPFC